MVRSSEVSLVQSQVAHSAGGKASSTDNASRQEYPKCRFFDACEERHVDENQCPHDRPEAEPEAYEVQPIECCEC
jgi:hypothetical protein